MATEGADVFAGGDRTDGSIAYKQLRESANPYDPKFTRPEVGIATVEPLQPVKNEKPDENSKPERDGTPAH